MLYVYVIRFDVMSNLKNFTKCFGNLGLVQFAKNFGTVALSFLFDNYYLIIN